jgi:hypothetical protein
MRKIVSLLAVYLLRRAFSRRRAPTRIARRGLRW